MMSRPNIFDFGTKELYQDAFICWLLSWAQDDAVEIDKDVHEIGRRFLDTVYAKCGRDPIPSCREIKVFRQKGRTDVVALINEDDVIIIEDKIGASEHSNQLVRYKESIVSEYPDRNQLRIYLKTGEQSRFRAVMDAGFAPLLRADMLSILSSKKEMSNHILADYYDWLSRLDADYSSYLTLPPKEWYWGSWQGFFAAVQERLGYGEWDYVPNPSGGFWGFWWDFRTWGDCQVYLQLEDGKLCFKIEVNAIKERSTLRDRWKEILLKSAPRIIPPPRLGHGTYMTVGLLQNDYRLMDDSGKIDIDKTITVLKECEGILDNAVSQTREV